MPASSSIMVPPRVQTTPMSVITNAVRAVNSSAPSVAKQQLHTAPEHQQETPPVRFAS